VQSMAASLGSRRRPLSGQAGCIPFYALSARSYIAWRHARRPPSDPALLQSFARFSTPLREAADPPTIRQLASATGYSDMIVRQVLAGRVRQSRRAVQAVAAALGGDAEEWDDAGTIWTWPCIRRAASAAPSKVAPTAHGRMVMVQHEPPARTGLRRPDRGPVLTQDPPDVCSVEGCDRPYRARGLCQSHDDAAEGRGLLRAERISRASGPE
jgi:hypothetical protein